MGVAGRNCSEIISAGNQLKKISPSCLAYPYNKWERNLKGIKIGEKRIRDKETYTLPLKYNKVLNYIELRTYGNGIRLL